MTDRYQKRLHFFAFLTAVATFFLIIAGALVTSNDAGLSVPDWPLSHGQLMPEMSGGVFYEHGHRMIAATVGLLTIVLNILLWRLESRSWVRYWGLAALGVVLVQGILGGITVLYYLPTPISVIHAGLAQVFFCMVLTVAVVTSPHWSGYSFSESWRKASDDGRFGHKFSFFLLGAVFIQLILGAMLRHSGTVNGSKGVEVIPMALIAHLLGALVVIAVSVLTVLAIIKSGREKGIVKLAYAVFALVFVQLILGFGAYLARIDPANRVQPTLERVFVGTAHVGLGALLLATCVLLVLKMTRQEGSKDSEPIIWRSRLHEAAVD